MLSPEIVRDAIVSSIGRVEHHFNGLREYYTEKEVVEDLLPLFYGSLGEPFRLFVSEIRFNIENVVPATFGTPLDGCLAHESECIAYLKVSCKTVAEHKRTCIKVMNDQDASDSERGFATQLLEKLNKKRDGVTLGLVKFSKSY